jgi:segregation and condensation protein A
MLEKNVESNTYRLKNFEGPLPFLLHLLQKNELEAHDVFLSDIFQQYLEKQGETDVDAGAEFVGSAATLIWLKSKLLLPAHEQIEENPIEEEDMEAPHALIPELIEYCKFKQAAKGLSIRELQQQAYYRGLDSTLEMPGKPLGIDHISLNELASLFQVVLKKASMNKGIIKEEIWRVSDKIHYLKTTVLEGFVPFHQVFSEECSREELIVTFLAVLELMKLGLFGVGKDVATGQIVLTRTGTENG